jgi:hypothetical protein
MNHLIVLFKNKKRKKIINRFKTLDRAKEFFSNKISESENVIFEKQVENALPCGFEIALLSKKDDNFQSLFVKDMLGRQVRVDLDDDDFKIIEVREYRVEEKIFDVYKNKKITTQEFLRSYINTPSIKLLSKLNNKVVLQNDDNIDLFTLKDPEECTRFLKSLSDYFISFLTERETDRANMWLTCGLSNGSFDPLQMVEHLDKHGIEARPIWKPMHQQPVLLDYPKYINGTSDAIFTCGICLPSGSSMTDKDQTRVINAIKKYSLQ